MSPTFTYLRVADAVLQELEVPPLVEILAHVRRALDVVPPDLGSDESNRIVRNMRVSVALLAAAIEVDLAARRRRATWIALPEGTCGSAFIRRHDKAKVAPDGGPLVGCLLRQRHGGVILIGHCDDYGHAAQGYEVIDDDEEISAWRRVWDPREND